MVKRSYRSIFSHESQGFGWGIVTEIVQFLEAGGQSNAYS